MSKLWIERREEDGRTVLRLAGHLGPDHLPLLERELAALSPTRHGAGEPGVGTGAERGVRPGTEPGPVPSLDLDLDLAGLTFLGCSAARRLNRLAEAGARLCNPPALIAEILEDDRCGQGGVPTFRDAHGIS